MRTVSLERKGALQGVAISFSDSAVWNEIAAISADQIEAIAKHIVAQMMGYLNLDVSFGQIGEQTYQATNGQILPIMGDKYDSSSQLMQSLLPSVIERIQHSFAIPSQFTEKGIEFLMIQSETKTGLVEQIPSQATQERVSQIIDKIKKDWQMQSFLFKTILKLDKQKSLNSNVIYFHLEHIVNDACFNEGSYTLEDFEKHAMDCSL